MERVKPIQRNASAAATEHEPYRPELIAEDEPRYLRRQKPVEIRRKKFTGNIRHVLPPRLRMDTSRRRSRRGSAAFSVRYLLFSPQVLLLKPDQIEVNGNHIVAREDVQKLFVPRSQP